MRQFEEVVNNLRRVIDEMSRGVELQAKAEEMGGFGMLIWDLESDQMWLSEGAYRVLGLRRLSAMAEPELVSAVMRTDNRERTDELLEESLAAAIAGGRHDFVHHIVLPSGAVRHVHARAQRIEGDATHPPILLGTVVDVTPLT